MSVILAEFFFYSVSFFPFIYFLFFSINSIYKRSITQISILSVDEPLLTLFFKYSIFYYYSLQLNFSCKKINFQMRVSPMSTLSIKIPSNTDYSHNNHLLIPTICVSIDFFTYWFFVLIDKNKNVYK